MTTIELARLSLQNRRPEVLLGSAAWAAVEAEMLLSSASWRWANTKQVVRHATWASAGVRPEQRELLVAAAYLHDIGSSAAIAESDCAALEGARHLRLQGLHELSRLVAHHTPARTFAISSAQLRDLARYPDPPTPVADALTYSILTSGRRPFGPAGDEQFEEISRWREPMAADLRSAIGSRIDTNAPVARAVRRANSNSWHPRRLDVTTIVMGCTTLVSVQGVLDESTAGRLRRTLHAVLDQRPHAVVFDLALLTGFTRDAARVLIEPTADRVIKRFVDPRPRDRHVLIDDLGVPASSIMFNLEAAVEPHCR